MRNRLRPAPARARLLVERLEDRLTPTTVVAPPTAFALSGTTLFAFDLDNPSLVSPIALTGVTAGETLVGIDVRPQNGFLYGLGVNATADTGTLYAISARTGVVTAVGAPGSVRFTTDGSTALDLPDPALVGYGFDFNPVVDRIRVVAGGLNFRINPNTGGPIDGNAAVAGTQPDAGINLGGAPATLDGAAYTNSEPNTTVTTQYVLDAATDSIRIQNPPNTGTQLNPIPVTLNGKPFDFGAATGFDIAAGVNAPASGMPVAGGDAYALLEAGGRTGLYRIDLTTGAATFVGTLANGKVPALGLAINHSYIGFPSVALTADGAQLIRFNTFTVGSIPGATVTVTGVAAGEALVGIDYRPATGQLYGLGVNGGANTATLYLIDPQTGAATAAVAGTTGAIALADASGAPVDLPAGGYGFDFNPTVDRIRVVTSSGLNFRLNPNTGTAVDGNAAVAGTQPDAGINGLGATGIAGTAYTNGFGQPLTGGVTSQYGLDPASDTLFIQTPPNTGTQTQPVPITLDGARLDFTEVSGFDIPAGVRVTASGTPAAGRAFAVLTVGGQPGYYQIDLATGAATFLGAAPTALGGLALGDAPAGSISFGNTTASAKEGEALEFIMVRRNGNNGAVSATVEVVGGSATAGTDFVAGPYTVTFADGETVASLFVQLNTDRLREFRESIRLRITAVTNAAVIGPSFNATGTVIDVAPPRKVLSATSLLESAKRAKAALAKPVFGFLASAVDAVRAKFEAAPKVRADDVKPAPAPLPAAPDLPKAGAPDAISVTPPKPTCDANRFAGLFVG
jgi:hypothetical protein